MKKIIYTLFIVLGCLQLNAQKIEVSASIDTNFLLIGEQTQIKLTVYCELDGKPVNVAFPILTDTISEFIEVIYTSPTDTIYPNKEDLSQVEHTQRITITSFDSGRYEIPYFEIIVNGERYQTESIMIDVMPMEVDTSKAIFDIKAPLDEPFSFMEWVKENWVWIAITLGLLLGGYLIIRYFKNRPEVIIEEVIPEIPLHVITLQKLQKLRDDQLWQSGSVKRHHSELSEIVRDYLEKRYEITALENTTDEIMQSLRFLNIPPDALVKLNQLLSLADLVKFAKEQPLADENESSLMSAVKFVQETKVYVAPTSNGFE